MDATIRYLPPTFDDAIRFRVTVGPTVGDITTYRAQVRDYDNEIDARMSVARYRGNNLNLLA